MSAPAVHKLNRRGRRYTITHNHAQSRTTLSPDGCGKKLLPFSLRAMSLTHVADALRVINERHSISIAEIAQRTGVHANTISRILKYERGQEAWKLTHGVLNGLESSSRELLWPDGKTARQLYDLPDSDPRDLPAADARLAHVIAAMVAERLTKRVRIETRLRDVP